jgi:hypothetical protein
MTWRARLLSLIRQMEKCLSFSIPLVSTGTDHVHTYDSELQIIVFYEIHAAQILHGFIDSM